MTGQIFVSANYSALNQLSVWNTFIFPQQSWNLDVNGLYVRKNENLRGFTSIHQVEDSFHTQSGRSLLKEWWQGGVEFRGQLCLGGRKAAMVAHAVTAGREPTLTAKAPARACSLHWLPKKTRWALCLWCCDPGHVSLQTAVLSLATWSSLRAEKWCWTPWREVSVTSDWC